MNDFAKGFVKGARETPRIFFAPAIAVWIILVGVTDALRLLKAKGEKSLNKQS